MSYTVKFIGFKSIDAAMEFVNWFGEQGEQDLIPWWEVHMEGESSPTLKRTKVNENEIIVELK